MANAVYTIPTNTETQRSIYTDLASLLEHLIPLGIDLVSIVKTPSGNIIINLDRPIPPDQAGHLGLIGRQS